jgi:hypothetical protein
MGIYRSGGIHHGGTEDTEKDKAKATTDLHGSTRTRLSHKGDEEEETKIHHGGTEDTEFLFHSGCTYFRGSDNRAGDLLPMPDQSATYDLEPLNRIADYVRDPAAGAEALTPPKIWSLA